MLYIGLMAGSSTDGVDAGLVGIDPGFELLATHHLEYPPDVKREIERRAREKSTKASHLFRLDVRLGRVFASAALTLLQEHGLEPAQVRAIGSHGQTLYHSPGGPDPYSIQIADPAVIAETTGITTIADFRAADIAAGGQGAPLTPAFHAAMFRCDADRVIVNVGGIANITALPARDDQAVLGFDTGPGNCLSDEWIQQQLGKPYDKGGAWAAQGRVDNSMLDSLMRDEYFAAPAPKTTSRDYFNLDWAHERHPQLTQLPTVDVQASLLAVSARAAADAIRDLPFRTQEVFVCGGGARNLTLLELLRTALAPLPIQTTAALGLAPEWVEATAFAWLAHARLEQIPGNLPSVTGARRARVLGAVYSGC